MQLTHKINGFTLVELMITVAIVGILATVVYPSYVSYVTKSNRTEAQRELMRLANLEEQYYVDHREYTENMKTTSGGGLEHEQEEIQVLELPIDTALQMIKSGEIKDGKTIMLLQYLRLENIF